MNGARYLEIFFICGLITFCEGITNNGDETNLIGEEERRGVDLKKDVKFLDQRKSATQKRGLWIIGQANPQTYPSGYDSGVAGNGYDGYSGPGYGVTSTGYGYDTGGPEGYHRGPTNFGNSGVGTGYGYNEEGFAQSGIGANFGHNGIGANFGHDGGEYGVSNYGASHGSDIYKKLALKKLLIPLAGLALLGAAAAFSSNPILLQLGTISGRRRRSIPKNQDVYPANPLVKPN